MYYAKIYDADGKLLRVYEGSPSGAELNTPPGGRIEELPAEVFNNQEAVAALFRDETS